MKNYITFSCVLFIILSNLFAQDIKSQQEINRDLKIAGVTENLQLPTITSNLISENNIINILQVGENNFSLIKLSTNNSLLDINQNGFNNYVNIDKAANTINQSISQNGNNNFILDQSLYTNTNILNRFTQDGDNLSLYNYGSNSMSDKMSVLQTGNQKSVIIINN